MTGSGKTFTMANLIAEVGRPALVIAHNKTLAAQLCNEFREFLPDNAVEYFVSYYDYYQPEAYIAATDTYIEKDSSINDEIDRLRHAATSNLLMRRDVVIVASVSCIYGLGSPEEYLRQVLLLKEGAEVDRDDVLHRLVGIHYERNDIDFSRGKFRVRGDSLEVWPAYEDLALRISLWGDEIEEIVQLDPLTQEVVARLPNVAVYPATHFVTTDDAVERAVREIGEELDGRVAELEEQGKALEAFRLRQRTLYDMEMLRELGLLQRHRELLAHPVRPQTGRAAVHVARLLPRRLPGARRRVAQHRPAAARHVPRRPQPQVGAGRQRLPPPVGPRQPAAALRRVPGQGAAGDLRVGHAGGVGGLVVVPGGRAAGAPHRAGRARGGGAAHAQPDRRPDERDPHSGGTATNARSSPR